MQRCVAPVLAAALAAVLLASTAVPARADATGVTGGDSLAVAPQLTSGQFAETFARGSARGDDRSSGLTKLYRLHLLQGQRLHMGASLTKPRQGPSGPDGVLGLAVELRDAAGKPCGEDGDATAMNNDVSPALTVAVSTRPIGALAADPCLQSPGDVWVAVTRYGDLLRNKPLTAQLSIFIEPAVQPSTLPAGYRRSRPIERVRVSGSSRPARGGTSFVTAAALRQGRYRDTIRPGETRFYAVSLQYGQRLSYQVDVPANPFTSSVELLSEVRTPVWTNLDLAVDDSHPDGVKEIVALDHWGRERLGASLPVPVRYRNHESEAPAQNQLWMPGRYYLLVFLAPPSSGRQADTPLPYTLTVQVSGAHEKGPQAVTTQQQGFTPGAVTPTPASPSPSGTTKPSSGAEASAPMWPLLAALLGALALATAGIVTLVTRRR